MPLWISDVFVPASGSLLKNVSSRDITYAYFYDPTLN